MNDKTEKSELPRAMCFKCYRPKKACFCEEILSFDTYFEFCILMHPKEAKLSHVGTGRIANVILNKSKIIVDENFDNNRQVQTLINADEYFPMVLYPGKQAINISSEDFKENYFDNKRPLLFIIDGTWPCAKSMFRDSHSLHKLPRISFDSSLESTYSIRHQPAKYCLSTIESIYQVLKNLERQGIENLDQKKEVLVKSLQNLVDFQIKCAKDPNLKSYRRNRKNYSSPSSRKSAKRWECRKVCFEDKNYYFSEGTFTG